MAFEITNLVAGFASIDAATVVAVGSPDIQVRRTPAGAPAGDFQVFVGGADFNSARTLFLVALDNPTFGGYSVNTVPAGALLPDAVRVVVSDPAGVATDVNFTLLALNRA